ncbi:hypothetical protein SLS62_004570 [Diatrype stigma]|uniref:Uncharacterized protein n=1 Tax=Diatrype stigma TaxID=117547 RepID=A0AAN9UR51_9PEZI
MVDAEELFLGDLPGVFPDSNTPHYYSVEVPAVVVTEPEQEPEQEPPHERRGSSHAPNETPMWISDEGGGSYEPYVSALESPGSVPTAVAAAADLGQQQQQPQPKHVSWDREVQTVSPPGPADYCCYPRTAAPGPPPALPHSHRHHHHHSRERQQQQPQHHENRSKGLPDDTVASRKPSSSPPSSQSPSPPSQSTASSKQKKKPHGLTSALRHAASSPSMGSGGSSSRHQHHRRDDATTTHGPSIAVPGRRGERAVGTGVDVQAMIRQANARGGRVPYMTDDELLQRGLGRPREGWWRRGGEKAKAKEKEKEKEKEEVQLPVRLGGRRASRGIRHHGS